MKETVEFDARFQTRNTNLAACLGALKIPIKSPDPCWVVEEAIPEDVTDHKSHVRKKVVTYFFEPASQPKDGSEPERADKVEWAWRNREKFEAENEYHPLVYMRAALDKLVWLTKVYYGQINPSLVTRHSSPSFCTEDIDLAACLMAKGHELHSFKKPVFHFSFQLSDVSFLIDDFASFHTRDTPMALMRRVLEVRKILIDLVKRAPTILHYQNGDPMEGGRDGYIAKGATEKNLNLFFELLYE